MLKGELWGSRCLGLLFTPFYTFLFLPKPRLSQPEVWSTGRSSLCAAALWMVMQLPWYANIWYPFLSIKEWFYFQKGIFILTSLGTASVVTVAIGLTPDWQMWAGRSSLGNDRPNPSVTGTGFFSQCCLPALISGILCQCNAWIFWYQESKNTDKPYNYTRDMIYVSVKEVPFSSTRREENKEWVLAWRCSLQHWWKWRLCI